MNLADFITDLQALAAKTPDGGASLDVRAVYNDRGDCRDAFPIWNTCIAEERYLHGEDPCVILSYK